MFMVVFYRLNRVFFEQLLLERHIRQNCHRDILFNVAYIYHDLDIVFIFSLAIASSYVIYGVGYRFNIVYIYDLNVYRGAGFLFAAYLLQITTPEEGNV